MMNIQKLVEEKDLAYKERNKLVAAFTKMAMALGHPAQLWRHPEDEKWEDDWRWIVAIYLPTGQVTWHIHDSELPLFAGLKKALNNWDGHNTKEKYDRVLDYIKGL